MAEERPPILMARRGTFLAPWAPDDAEAMEELPTGKQLTVRVSMKRSSPQLRLYFSLLSVVAKNLDQDVTKDDLHEWVKIKLGYTTPVRQRNGQILWVAKSVAVDKMDHPTFTKYFAEVKALITEQLIPGLKSAALEREARAMLGEPA